MISKRPHGRFSAISNHEFARIIRECEGNFSLASRLMQRDRKTIYERAMKIPELFALYSNRGTNSPLPEPPTEATTMLRSPGQLPMPIPAADLGQMVRVTEKLLSPEGLARLGVPVATLTKLRDLRSLNIDFGGFLAVSLQDTHQLYYLQLLGLQARADEIKRLYLSEEEPDPEGKRPAVDPLQRMFWQRAHTEIVEQLGKGWDRMMAGTQAMVAMEQAKGGKGGGKDAPKAVEAGWEIQVPKSVQRKAAS